MVLLAVGIAVTSPASQPARSAVAQASTIRGGGQLSAGQPIVIGFIHMLSASTGWAFGGTPTQPAILRTSDGGTTWSEVSPNVNLQHSFTLFHFVGSDHVWVGVPGVVDNHRVLTAYRSIDAGTTWTKGDSIVLPDSYRNPVPIDPGLQFVDPRHGWLTMAFQVSDQTSAGVGVYATSDAGAHWQLVSLSLDQPGASTPGGLPLGCLKTGIVFSSPTAGWATAHCSDGSLFFFASHDGGRSWHTQSLPSPAGYPANLFGNCQCTSVPPLFATANDGVLMLHSPDLLYVTHDGGVTWQAVLLPSKYVAETEFVDGKHGWLNAQAADPATHAIRPDRLYVTSDGGQSWTPVVPDHPLAGDLNFADSNAGWLIDRHLAGPPTLYQTTDGGKSWKQIHPQLIGRPSQTA